MARLGGIFPFPIANVSEGGTRIHLTSGSVWYPPAGQYLIMLDAQSLVEYWDPQANFWRTLMGHSTGGPVTVDGVNYRVRNDSGTLTLGAFTAGGSGLVNGIGPGQTGVNVTTSGGTQTATPGNLQGTSLYAIVGGVAAAPTVTQAGTGYLVPPLIVFDPPPVGGQQAYGYATLTGIGGGIASVVMTSGGAGYLSPPNASVIPQMDHYGGGPSGGIAAAIYPPPGIVHPNNAVPGNQNTSSSTGTLLTAAALTGSGTITGVVLVAVGGSWVTTAPTVAFASTAGGSVAGAAQVLTLGAAAALAVVTVAPRVVE